jgi:acetyl esterase/lipase
MKIRKVKMKIKISIHIFLVSAMTSVSCQAIPKQEPNSPEPTPSKVIIYKSIDNVKLKLYIFDPAEVNLKPVPVIVFFHGGGWKRGDPSQFYRHCQYLASQGILAISAQYRLLSDKITVRDCVTDGKSAIRWLRQNAKKFNIDPNLIAAAGGSAGGHIAACTALIDKYDETSEDLKISSKPNALILFNPALDITILKITPILGEEPFNLSPAHHLDKTLPPTLIMHGTADTAVPIESVRKFSRHAGKIGCNCHLVEFKGRPHAFFNYSKSKEDFQTCLDEVEDFLVSLGYIKTRK